MKVKINPQPKFTPIEMTITFEKKREIELLLCLFNQSPNSFKEICNNSNEFGFANINSAEYDFTYEVFLKLKEALSNG